MKYDEWYTTISLSCTLAAPFDQGLEKCKDPRNYNNYCGFVSCPKRPDLVEALEKERDRLLDMAARLEVRISQLQGCKS
ncbi:MAG: hypothetical protein QMD46_12730 [Methanomicrobiales archaeon]|nr:hypothetical protein [Methanomicrobiales archaeon]